MKYNFIIKGEIFEWRGPAPFYFIKVGSRISAEIKSQAKNLSYGWGVIPVHGKVGETEFSTSLFPKDGQYLVPLKDEVRRRESLEMGDSIKVQLNLGKPKSR